MGNVYLVTGTAGFIGFWTATKLLDRGERVIGMDSHNDYYDVRLKKARTDVLLKQAGYTHVFGDISDCQKVKDVFCRYSPNYICNLAAYAGVPYSMNNPFPYEKSNGLGFIQLLEVARLWPIKNFVFASSSSVYGNVEDQTSITEEMNTETPLSIYSASKKYNELLSHVYSNFYKIPMTGLRFFTVYGPWGRPDMAMFKWVDALYENKPLYLNNFGNMWRDFTYVEDIVDGVIAALDNPQPLGIYNLGRGEPAKISNVVKLLQEHTGIEGIIEERELPEGEILFSMANVSKAKRDFGYEPKVSVREGTQKFVEWYKWYYGK